MRLHHIRFCAGIIIFGLLILIYFFGPESKLTLLSRVHYNTLFVLTPCLGETKSYEDESIKFNYTKPPGIFSHITPSPAPSNLNPSYHSPFEMASEVIDMGIAISPSYKYKIQSNRFNPTEKTGIGPEPRTVNLKKGVGVIKTENPIDKDLGFEYLYITGKNDYTYRISMPFYVERIINKSWFYRALYHSGILSWLQSVDYSISARPRGFFTWFITPCADKQAYCSTNTIMKSLEVKD